MARRPMLTRSAPPAIMALALSMLVLAACGGPGAATRRAASDAVAPIVAMETQDRAAAKAAPGTASPSVMESPAPLAMLESVSPDPGPEPGPESHAAPAQKAARARINDDPDQLMGLAPHAVSRLLGPPSLLRTEAPAQVWQYAAQDCVLDIYLYAEEKKPHRSRVTYYEIRLPDTARIGARACFAELIESWNLAAKNALEL